MAALTALDIITLLLIGGAAVFGFMRGFVTEALSLLAWVLAVVAVKFLHAPAVVFVTPYVGSTSGAYVLALALVFGVTFLVGRLIAQSLGRRTRQSVLGPVDRILGFGFGVVKGVIAASLLFLLATLLADVWMGTSRDRPDWIVKARTYPFLNASSRALIDMVEARRGADTTDDDTDEPSANKSKDR